MTRTPSPDDADDGRDLNAEALAKLPPREAAYLAGLLARMNDESLPVAEQLEAAIEALPWVHGPPPGQMTIKGRATRKQRRKQ